jgi:hypothetical protein
MKLIRTRITKKTQKHARDHITYKTQTHEIRVKKKEEEKKSEKKMKISHCNYKVTIIANVLYV